MEALPLHTNDFHRRLCGRPSLYNSSGLLNPGSVKKPNNILSTERGFTLLEILAVLFIIGIIASFAGLSIGQRGSRSAQEEAERLYGLVKVVSEEAVLQGRELALEVTQESYRFLELTSENKWILIEADVLYRERKLPPDVKIALIVEGSPASFDDEKNLPRIFILSSGELTAFELNLSLEQKMVYTLRGSITGKLELSQADESDLDV